MGAKSPDEEEGSDPPPWSAPPLSRGLSPVPSSVIKRWSPGDLVPPTDPPSFFCHPLLKPQVSNMECRKELAVSGMNRCDRRGLGTGATRDTDPGDPGGSALGRGHPGSPHFGGQRPSKGANARPSAAVQERGGRKGKLGRVGNVQHCGKSHPRSAKTRRGDARLTFSFLIRCVQHSSATSEVICPRDPRDPRDPADGLQGLQGSLRNVGFPRFRPSRSPCCFLRLP